MLLHNYCSMTLDESIVTLLDLYITHKWTKASLNENLRFLHAILPDDNCLPNSIYKLFRYVQDMAPSFNVIKHFYCGMCSSYNGIDSKINQCCSCGTDKKSISYFFEIDICQQIRTLFEHRNLAEKLKPKSSDHDKDVITDITDGSEYLRINSRINRQNCDLTLILNTDGLSLVKSSKSHCWALLCTIVELPDYLRESFLIVIGLYYDNKHKPVMNTFLNPFCEKLKDCFESGIQWVHPQTQETIVSRLVVPLVIADAPARTDVQNILYFNGKYGCNICEIKMQQCTRVQKKRSRQIYPFIGQDNIK